MVKPQYDTFFTSILTLDKIRFHVIRIHMNFIKISSWNINSVRLRLKMVKHFLQAENPTLLCLQETKTEDAFFPTEVFHDLGYPYLSIFGEKSYNGVSIISKIPFKNEIKQEIIPLGGMRYNCVTLYDKIILKNFYIPAGGDEADEEINPKFKHKMDFLRYLRDYYTKNPPKNEILVGDFNIAPHENDVWSHKQLLSVVSHTPQEVALLEEFRLAGNFCDIARHLNPETLKLYSWWSYRAKDWAASNRGRRLDHIWCSSDLTDTIHSYHIARHYRGFERPSDHVPVSVVFDMNGIYTK